MRVGGTIVTSVHDDQWTHYEVLDVNGKLTVSALRKDVYIDLHPKKLQQMNERERERSHTLVREGEQISREEKCGAAGSTPTPGVGPVLNSPYASGAGAVGIGAIAGLALWHNDDPASPAKP